jgi:hypothetical protein
MKNFVVIIDNEAAVNVAIPEPTDLTNPTHAYFEKVIAALSSNPIIVQSDIKVQEGSTWDGQGFTPPVE